MELQDIRPHIDVLKDITTMLNRLSESYNAKLTDLQQEIDMLKKERASVVAALQQKNYQGLNEYFNIDT